MGSKVLHIIDNMKLGGAQRIVATLEENNSNHVLHSIRETEESMGGNVDYTTTKTPNRYNIRSLVDCWKLIRNHDPEIVHCHLIKSKLIGISLKILSRKDFSLVLHEHGHIWKGRSKYNKILEKTSNIVDCHIAVSKHTAKLIEERGKVPSEKIEVIYNFVDREEYNPEILEEYKDKIDVEIDEEMFTAGYGGRLEERKGWKTVVSAAQEAEEIQFLMSGSGSGEEALIEISETEDNLYYLGFLEDIRILFANIDCLILPSHWDPSPMILYEIQACGIPLVCTDTQAIDELVEDGRNGLLFEPENTEQLLERLREVSNDSSLRADLSIEELSSAEKHSYENYEKSLDELYEKLEE